MCQAAEREPLLHRRPPLVRSHPLAGQLSVSPTRSSGRCTSSSLLRSWRSVYSVHSLSWSINLTLFVLSTPGHCPLLVCSSSVWSGTTLCSGTCWVCGGCSHSCSTAGLYRCRGNTSNPARPMLLSGDYATTWPFWLTTCSTTCRWVKETEGARSIKKVYVHLSVLILMT